MTGDDFREIALKLDGVTEKAHMNHPDFRANGRIFASLLSNEQRAGLKLSPEEQREFVRRHPTAFAPGTGRGGARVGPSWTWGGLRRPPCEVPSCWLMRRSPRPPALAAPVADESRTAAA